MMETRKDYNAAAKAFVLHFVGQEPDAEKAKAKADTLKGLRNFMPAMVGAMFMGAEWYGHTAWQNGRSYGYRFNAGQMWVLPEHLPALIARVDYWRSVFPDPRSVWRAELRIGAARKDGVRSVQLIVEWYSKFENNAR